MITASTHFPKPGYSLGRGERSIIISNNTELNHGPKLIKGGPILEQVICDCLKEPEIFRHASVCILLTDDFYDIGTQRYKALQISTQEKIKAFNRIGVTVKAYSYNLNTTCEEFGGLLGLLSNDVRGNNAIIVQTPIPVHLRPELQKIIPAKDIDGLSFGGDHIFPICATAEACMRIVRSRVNSKTNIAVLGGNGFVGKSIVSQLRRERIPHVIFEIEDKLNLEPFDTIISATGVPKLLTLKQINTHKKLLVDIGFHPLSKRTDIPLEVAGDADQKIYHLFEEVTPVPGGMGPLQMATLLERFRFILTGKQKQLWETA